MKKLILLFILISGLSYSDDMPQTENYNVNDVMIGDIVGGGSGLNPIPGYDPAMHKQGVGNVISDKQERAIKKIVEETKKGAIDGAVKGIVEGKGIKNVMIDATKGAVEGSIRGINDVINEKSMTKNLRKFYENVTGRYRILQKHMFLSFVCNNNIRKSQKN